MSPTLVAYKKGSMVFSVDDQQGFFKTGIMANQVVHIGKMLSIGINQDMA
ncbi:hypothetical protein SDC9_139508 [bioreactor metagenome]|uniref:Uncharacterized protein n=1 Tax=bioreactor metagenome TaxID=1076179 RepID=A0A645DUW3_9ZZZZ